MISRCSWSRYQKIRWYFISGNGASDTSHLQPQLAWSHVANHLYPMCPVAGLLGKGRTFDRDLYLEGTNAWNVQVAVILELK